jgi:hypothetical protein
VGWVRLRLRDGAALGSAWPLRRSITGQKGDRMKRMSLVLVVGLLAATILSGCVIVPLGGWWYGDGGYYGGGGYYRYHSSPYRPYYHRDR